MNYRKVKANIERILEEHEVKLTKWETDFMASIYEKLDEEKELTKPENEKIAEIILKY